MAYVLDSTSLERPKAHELNRGQALPERFGNDPDAGGVNRPRVRADLGLSLWHGSHSRSCFDLAAGGLAWLRHGVVRGEAQSSCLRARASR